MKQSIVKLPHQRTGGFYSTLQSPRIDTPSLFLCLGLMGPLRSTQHGPIAEQTFSRAVNTSKSSKSPGFPTGGSKQKSHKFAAFHTSVSAVVCKHCGKQFNDMTKFKAHASYHENESRYSCKFCGKAFHSRGVTLRHERVHTGEKPFRCRVCNAGFNQKANCKRHESTHEGYGSVETL